MCFVVVDIGESGSGIEFHRGLCRVGNGSLSGFLRGFAWIWYPCAGPAIQSPKNRVQIDLSHIRV